MRNLENKFANILKINEPGGLVLDNHSKKTDRAPIDISISRTNTIEFPWDNNLVNMPDDIDVFKKKIKNHLKLDDYKWEELNLSDLKYKVKAQDVFYYTLVEALSTETPQGISQNSKVLLYNKFNNSYYEPYKIKTTEDSTLFQLFKKEEFDDINNVINNVKAFRLVFRPKKLNLNEEELRFYLDRTPLNGGQFPPTINPFPSLPNIPELSFFNKNNTDPNDLLRDFLNYNEPPINYITGDPLKIILNELKASHTKQTNDPFEDAVKKPSQWTDRSFYVLKENNIETIDFSPVLLQKQITDKNTINTYYTAIVDDTNKWITHINNQFYLISTIKDIENFNTRDAFLNLWDDGIEKVELISYVLKDTTVLTHILPFSKQYDIGLSAILNRHREITQLKSLTANRKNLANALGKKIETIADYDFEDFKTAIEDIEDKYNSLITADSNLLQEERALIERVKKFGYEIETEGDSSRIFKTINFIKATVVTYRKKKRKRIRIGLFARITRTVWRTYKKIVYLPATKKETINVAETPWVDDLKILIEKGFNIYFFELTDNGYETENGDSLNSIMEGCKLSETIRLNTALMIPIYDQSPVNGIRKIGYDLIVRPLHNDVPSRIPDISFEESLAYRASWSGVELGELIESINLAPGEARNINVKQTFQSTKSETQSVTTILDVTEKQSTMFSDFFEQTNRKSKETTKTKSWSAKAGGSYGGVNGSVSGKGSKKQTNKSFAQQIKRAANESSREMKKQSRVEINTKLSESSKLTIDESINSQIHNINDGKSLNLFFYRLDNVYKGGLHLENFKLTYTRPTSIIKGTNIQDIRTFDLFAFNDFLDLVSTDLLLLTVNDLDHIEQEAREIEIRFSIVFKVFKKLFREYMFDLPNTIQLSYPETLDNSMEEISGRTIPYNSIKNPLKTLIKTIEKHKKSYKSVADKLNEFKRDEEWFESYKPLISALRSVQFQVEEEAYRLFNSLNFEPIAIEGYHAFSIPSNAAYLDCVMGSSSGLEDYSELMRIEELRKRQAETNLIIAQTKKINTSIDFKETYPIAAISITNYSVNAESSIITLNKPIPEGIWYVKSNDKHFLTSINEDRTIITIPYVLSQTDQEHISIVESTSGIYIKN